MHQAALTSAPIHEALLRLQPEQLALHMPGHKQGRGGATQLRQWLPGALPFDVTEIADLDSIQHPSGPLLWAEQLAAALYQVKSTHFTTNGSTAGLIGGLLASVPTGSEVILPRNAHLSILSALVLGDLVPRFVSPAYDQTRPLGITSDQLSDALRRHPGARAVLLVSPSYHGAVADCLPLTQLAHAAGCLVVVDEAHGAHLGFHPELPPSAVHSRADLVVQSAHKTLSALTGGAWVHRVSDRVSAERLRSCLNLVQSTSPSWLILGSLDLARRELATEGPACLQQVIANARLLRQAIVAAGFALGDVPPGTGFLQDPLKIQLQGLHRGVDGPQLAAGLAELGIYPEMASRDGVLLMLGMGDVQLDSALLVRALQAWPAKQPIAWPMWQVPPQPELVMRPREAYFADLCWVELRQAIGRTAARPVYAYPPGVPLVYPGERIDANLVTYALALLGQETDLVGLKGTTIAVVE